MIPKMLKTVHFRSLQQKFYNRENDYPRLRQWALSDIYRDFDDRFGK